MSGPFDDVDEPEVDEPARWRVLVSARQALRFARSAARECERAGQGSSEVTLAVALLERAVEELERAEG